MRDAIGLLGCVVAFAACSKTVETANEEDPNVRYLGSFVLEVDPLERSAAFKQMIDTTGRGIHVPAPFGNDGTPGSGSGGTFEAVTTQVRIPGEAGCGSQENCFTVVVESFANRAIEELLMRTSYTVPATGHDAVNSHGVVAGSGLTEGHGTWLFGNIAPLGTSGSIDIRLEAFDMTPYRILGDWFERDVPPGPHTLDVQVAGGGSGYIISSPPGIFCPAGCSEDYVDGTPVTLTAAPNADSDFIGWSEPTCPSVGPCTVTMTSARVITGTFELNQTLLDVVVVGMGQVTSTPPGIVCPGDCSEVYSGGTPVILTALPDPGWRFVGWSEPTCPGVGPCTFTMTGNRAITATFEPNLHHLTVIAAGGGSGYIISSPGIFCPGDCSEDYVDGTPVTLTAAPNADSDFIGWSEPTCPGVGPCTVTMDQDRVITGTFDLTSTDIIFLHHSTGQNVWDGGVPSWFAAYNTANQTNYNIVERAYPDGINYPWDNYPYDYWNIWVNNAGPAPYMGQDTLEILTQTYEVIVFKHCFPVSIILPDFGAPDVTSPEKQLQHYMTQYDALRPKMHTFPATQFIVWTGAVETENLAPDQAQRAFTFFEWVKSTWDQPGDNIHVFDFYNLETEFPRDGYQFMRMEHAQAPTDAHPNAAFSISVAPSFSQRVVDVIEGRGDTGSLTPGFGFPPYPEPNP